MKNLEKVYAELKLECDENRQRIEKLESELANKPHNIKDDVCDNQELMDFYNKIKPNLLTQEEKEYLSAVIKPFRDRVKYLKLIKIGYPDTRNGMFIWLGEKGINIYEENNEDCGHLLPYTFEYKGLEKDKQYYLSELGL